MQTPAKQPSLWFTKRVLIAYVLCAVSLVIYLSPLNELLAYDRQSPRAWITALLSSHYTHLSLPHLLINFFALIVIYYLFIEDVSIKVQLALLVFLGVCVGLGIQLLTDIERYTGFSGICHGMLIAGALLTFHRKDRWINILVIIGTLIKLVDEALTEDRSSPLFELGYVAIEAHQFGVAGAVIFSSAYYVLSRTFERT